MLRVIYNTINKKLLPSEKKCFKGIGEITFINQLYGIINDELFFKVKPSDHFAISLVKGMKVTYLAYRQSYSQTAIIAKIFSPFEDIESRASKRIRDNCLDRIHSKIQQLINIDWILTDVHECTLIGEVIHFDNCVINFRTSYCDISVRMKDYILDFNPSNGDQFYIYCQVNNIGNSFKILNIIDLEPIGVKSIKNKITQLEKSWGVIEEIYFFSKYLLPIEYTPQIDDEITAKVVESKKKSFDWRCIEVTSELNQKMEL